MKTKTRSKAPASKHRLTDAFLRNLKPRTKTYMVWDDRQSRFGVQVTPAGTITFKCTYTFGKRLRWISLARYPSLTLKDARDIAQTIQAKATLAKAMGEKDPMAKKVADREGKALREVAASYVERYAKQANKSWRQGENLMKKYILPKLGTQPAEEIIQQDIQRIFNHLTIDENKPVLANQVLAAVSAVLQWAVQQHIIEQNVAYGIKRNKVKAEERFLTDEEVKSVWPELVDPLRLILVLGQRPGEIANMRWDDIDLNKKIWTLPGEPDGTWPGTKNARTHEVPLSEQAIAILEELGPKEKGMVFNGQIPRTGGIWKELNIPRFRPHDLRATASTGMDLLGFTEEHIGRVLNHAQSGVTQSYIRHSHFEQKRQALEAWGGHLQAVVEGRQAPSSVVPIRSAR